MSEVASRRLTLDSGGRLQEMFRSACRLLLGAALGFVRLALRRPVGARVAIMSDASLGIPSVPYLRPAVPKTPR